MNTKIVCYYRVSTDKQGVHGPGMKAQRTAVTQYLKGEIPIAEFEEVESGKRSDRPELAKALTLCRQEKATLIIAKIDRLARNSVFLLSLKDSGVDFIAADMPGANRLTVGIMALIAEDERERISARTKAALAERKRDGVRLGNPRWQNSIAIMCQRRSEITGGFRARLLPIVKEIKAAGIGTLHGIAECLDRRGYKTFTGRQFQAHNVANLLKP